MADKNEPMVGAGASSVQRSEETSSFCVDHDVPLRFATASGVVFFSSEGFTADVVNSVNDLILSGFDSLEEFAAKALDLRTEGARCALRNGVNKIYNKVQDNLDEHLSRWESICRGQYFNMASEARILGSSDKKVVTSKSSKEAARLEELQDQEEMLDKELCSLRSQLITAERDEFRMRMELNSLKKKLALSIEVNDTKNLTYLDSAVLEEVKKSADELLNKMDKVSSLQIKRRRQQFVPSICSKCGDEETNVPPGYQELVSTDITEGGHLFQLCSRKRMPNDVQKESEFASVNSLRFESILVRPS